MYKLSALLIGIFCLSASAFSQTITVSGTIKDTSEKKPIRNAVVALLSVKDSILYKFTRTAADGSFTIKNVVPGNYIAMITHPFYADLLDNMEAKDADTKIGTLSLTSKSKLLQEVIVKSGNPIRIKGDTTIYTADSFKVGPNANVEELLKKLPGIQVDKDGKIKAMGETVEKVLVDGEEFFGDDPGMAVKNLRADAVKEVQVFDKKSDQAEFTGIDDGNTKKTINLKLKDDKKKGYFGKIEAAGGQPEQDIDPRYNTNVLLSSFKGKRKITGFVLNGNTGQDGLSWQDQEKFGGENENFSMNMDDDGNVMFMWNGGGSDGEPYVNTENGFIRNTNAGLQYSNKWNDKQTFNISPKYNSQIYNNNNTEFIQNQYDSVLNTNASTATNVNRKNFKTNASYEIKLDSNNTVKFTARANFYHTESSEQIKSFTTGPKGGLVNSSETNQQYNTDKAAYYGSILYKHRFKKPRRTLSLNADWNLLNTDGDNYLKSNNQIYGPNASSQIIDQYKPTDKSTQNISASLIYTEPLSKKYSLEISHQLTTNSGTNNQLTYNYSNLTGRYDLVVDSLSNQFEQMITVNRPGLKINYNNKKIKYNFGSAFGFTHFNLLDKSYDKDYIRNYTNFFPSASFTYSYKSNHSLRFNYNGNTSQPSINQLQPLRNNTDFFNQYLGNPDLKPSFTNNFRLSHNSYNFIKELNTYQSVNIRMVSNAISNSRTLNRSTGASIIKPVNTNGNISANFYGGAWFKLKKLKLQMGINPNVNFSKFNSILRYTTSPEDIKVVSKTLNTGISVYLSKNKDKKYDISLGNQFNYNRNTTTQTNTIVRQFNTNNIRLDATVYYKKVWSLSTDYNFFMRQKTPDFQSNLTNQLWNVRIQRTFKNDVFTAYIIVRDVLNQNIGIERSFSEYTLSEERNDRLKRYGMIGFAWNFKNKGAAVKK